jgi:lysozyme
VILRPSFIERVKQEEGFTEASFWDDAPGGGGGQWTWGYGTVAPGQNCKITMDDAAVELRKEIDEAERDFRVVFPTDPPGLTPTRYEALVDMLFNLGMTRFNGFTYTIASVRAGNWVGAAAHAQASLWYKQVGKRAKRIVAELGSGIGADDAAVPPPSSTASVPVPAFPQYAQGPFSFIDWLLSILKIKVEVRR